MKHSDLINKWSNSNQRGICWSHYSNRGYRMMFSSWRVGIFVFKYDLTFQTCIQSWNPYDPNVFNQPFAWHVFGSLSKFNAYLLPIFDQLLTWLVSFKMFVWNSIFRFLIEKKSCVLPPKKFASAQRGNFQNAVTNKLNPCTKHVIFTW